MFEDAAAEAAQWFFGFFDDEQGEGMGVEGDGLGIGGGSGD